MENIRFARLGDCAQMLEIYGPFVSGSAVSFEYEIPSLEDYEQRFLKIAGRFPWIVYEVKGKILGFCYASTYRERKAYQWHVETSVYMHPEARGKKLGRLLYDKLFEILAQRNFKMAYAVTTLPNEASVAFHTSFGFTELASFPKAGFKNGAWHDILFMQKPIGDQDNDPLEPLFVSQL